MVGYVVAPNEHALLRPWFLAPDEWVYAFEVIRFSTGDFQQRFYGNPGTPLMLLSTATLWFMYLPSCVAAGSAPQCATFGSFAYANVPMVIGILRFLLSGATSSQSYFSSRAYE